MSMKLERKDAFVVIGFSTVIAAGEGYQKCPEFWEKAFMQKYQRLWATRKPETPEEQAICDNGIGNLGVCIEGENGFEYMIGGIYRGGTVPEGMKLYSFPASDWAVFTTKGALPKSLQQLNAEVWQKWYPTEGQAFLPNGRATVEFYAEGDTTAPDYACGIWIPVVKKMIAYCGLDCEKCDAYIATVQDDQALREQTAKRWSELNQVEITPEMIHCTGCRGEGAKTVYCDSMCEIRKCAQKEERASCAFCDKQASCEKLKPVLDNSEEARNNLTGAF